MTRFWLELEVGVNFTIDSFIRMKGGEHLFQNTVSTYCRFSKVNKLKNET